MTLAPPIRSSPRPGAIALVLAWLLLLGVLAAAVGYVLMVPGQVAHEPTRPEQAAPERLGEGPGTDALPEPVLAESGTVEPIPETLEHAAAPEPVVPPDPEPAPEPAPETHATPAPPEAPEAPKAESAQEPEPDG